MSSRSTTGRRRRTTRGRFQPVLPPALPAVRRGRVPPALLGLWWPAGSSAFLSLFLVLPFLLANTGIAGFVIGFIASLIPLAAVLLAVRFIDRWEPEPKRLLLFAFTWGAVVSIAVTLLIQPVFLARCRVRRRGLDFHDVHVTVQAPVVEEFAKSLGLLLLLLLRPETLRRPGRRGGVRLHDRRRLRVHREHPLLRPRDRRVRRPRHATSRWSSSSAG